MIIILGCDHCLQDPERTSGFWQGVEQTPRARRQREGFRDTFQCIVRTDGCDFIGEESKDGQSTPALCLAKKLGLRYQNIDMTPAERDAAGIPEGYSESPQHGEAQKQGWHRIREQHMIEEVEAARGDCKNLLIVCGVQHMLPLYERFRQGSEETRVIDVTKAPWFSGPLQSEWLFE